MAKKLKRGTIEKSLIEQLEAQHKDTRYAMDLVADYMRYYDVKQMLFDDIQTNGLRIQMVNGNGFRTEKPNESVPNLNKITATMLKILAELGLKDPATISKSDEEDYL